MLPEDNLQDELERKKFAYEMYRKEVDYRREKAWKIFSWASTIFLGVTAGLIALYSKQSSEQLLLPPQNKMLLTFALLVLTVYSCLWVHRNTHVRRNVKSKMNSLGLVDEIESGYRFLGYVTTLILLSIVAILSIWVISK